MLTEVKLQEILDHVRHAVKKAANSPTRKVQKLPDYSPIYEMAVEQMDAIKIHAEKGTFPEKLFALRSPNETEQEQKYRRDTYKQITLPVFIDYMSVQSRAYADANWSVEYKEESEAYEGETYREYVDSEIEHFGSLENFIFNVLTTNKAIDANGALVIKPRHLPVNEAGEIESETLIEPQPFYVPCTRVVDISENFAVVESLEKSEVRYGGQVKKIGYVFEVFDEVNIYHIRQVGEYIDYKFEIVLWFSHNTGFVPARRLMGVPRLLDEALMYQSPFSFVTDNLDLAVLDASNLSISKSRTAFPIPVSYGQICEFENDEGYRCADGMVNGDQCPSCKGSGLKSRLNPMTGILLKPRTTVDEGDSGLSQAPLQYVSPSSEILQFLDEQIDKHIERARQILHLPDADSPVQGNEGTTATGSNNKLKALYSFLKPISDQTFDLYEFALVAIGRQRYGDNFEAPKVNRPVTFDFKTESDYLADIENSRKAQMPSMVLHTQMYRYLNTFYYNETQSGKVLNLIVSVDRLFGMTFDEISMKLARNLVAGWEDTLHNSAVTFVGQLIQEDPNFLDKDFASQQEALINKAKETADSLKQTPTRSSLIEGIAQ